jgi:uncharacterized protein (DUF2235 family)
MHGPPPVGVIDSSERFDAAIEAIEKRSPVPKDEWLAMTKLERENAFTVAHVTQADVLQQVLDAMETAVSVGAVRPTARVPSTNANE